MPIIGVIASSAKGAPGVPTSVSATNVGSGRAFNNGRADVSFTPGAGATATSFTVTSSPGGFTGTGASSPISVTGLQSNVSYTFTVTATNAAGTSDPSAPSNSITATTVPQAPTIGTATAGNATASVTFTAGATGGSAITGFTATSSPGSITGTNTVSPITVSGLTNGTTYTFTVTATNANGTSAPSAASNSVTPANPLAFESIATLTGAGGGTLITFSNIPQDYQTLQLRIRGVTELGPSAGSIRCNGDTANNYSNIFFEILPSQVAVGQSVNAVSLSPAFRTTSNTAGGNLNIINFYDYKSTTKLKTVTIFRGQRDGDNVLYIQQGIYQSTNAINSITLVSAFNFVSQTRVELYGIRGA